jgi:hypothetical protein
MQRTFQREDELRDFAAEFALKLQPGDVVALSGPLGAGKTTFVKAAVRARTGDDPVTSPTFTFWHRYRAETPIDHIDLYRIEDPRELAELGLDDAFGGESIVFVEWWAHAQGRLPRARFDVEIEGVGEAPRHVTIRGPAS